MKYDKRIVLKNGVEAILRNGDASDGPAVYENFNLIHAETGYLLAYSDENSFDPEQEGRFLEELTESPNEIMILAVVDGNIAGTAVIEAVGKKDKVKHRAELGISLLKEYWGFGLGKALAEACIHCAVEAGYEQVELNVIADNERAMSLYRGLGFEEFGRNPTGYKSRTGRYQEVVYMLRKL